MLLGRAEHEALVVMDAFALPVTGTETRVNASQQASEYMAEYVEMAKAVGRPEHVIGWYHSHPGYGCWLSGIDVGTQMMHQKYQEPFVALVVDPTRTAASGRVHLGAFRTYPAGYKPDAAAASEFQSIPLAKIEDFGAHSSHYYSLDISYFKSSLDRELLDSFGSQFWLSTLTAPSPLLAVRLYFARSLIDTLLYFQPSLTTISAVLYTVLYTCTVCKLLLYSV